MKTILKAVGIFLIIWTIWALLTPADSANAASGLAKVFLLFVSPFIVGLGILLFTLGSPPKESTSTSVAQKPSFNSASVNPATVIFVIGFIIQLFLIIWIARFFS